MIGEGERAPRFELPGVVDGAVEPVALEGQLTGNVVVLAFYPGDFNPACESGTAGIEDLDLLSMQRNVVVLGISGDSVYSHRAFADQHNLTIPLLSDVTGTVATEYGVAVESGRPTHATRRAVVVVDPDGDVRYTWLAGDSETLPDVEDIRAAVEGIDDEATARARYRVGHAHYVEGRRAFTSAMNAFEDREWLLAERDFERAHEELLEAAERFGTAGRFAESERSERDYDHAQEKARTLGQAADWLTGAAGEFVRGNSAEAESLRQDAEQTIEPVQAMDEPVEPADVGAGGESPSGSPPSSSGQLVRSARGERSHATTTDDEGPATATGRNDRQEGDRIDEREIEEITAELEEQTEARRDDDDGEPDSRAGTGPGTERLDDSSETVDATNIEDDLDEGEIDLDLTDPTESSEDTDAGVDGTDDGDGGSGGDGDDTDDGDGGSGDDLGGGGHGVPDSL